MKKPKWMQNTEIRALLYLLPSLVIITIFQFYPIFKSFAMGFYTKFDYLTDTVYETGLGNFKYVFSDPDFYLAMKNTCIFVVFAVPLGIMTALVLAVLIDRQNRLKAFFQSVYFLPFVTSTVSVSIVWSWMLNKDFGLINALLKLLGMPKVAWLTNPEMTIPILIAFSVWKGLGYKIILILAALQGVDQQYYAASRIDGAKSWQQFLHITIPLLKPCLTFLYITSTIAAFKIFDEVYIMYAQQPGPIKSGLTIVYYIFTKFYRHWEFAIAAAAAFILFVIILILTLIQFFIAKRLER